MVAESIATVHKVLLDPQHSVCLILKHQLKWWGGGVTQQLTEHWPLPVLQVLTVPHLMESTAQAILFAAPSVLYHHVSHPHPLQHRVNVLGWLAAVDSVHKLCPVPGGSETYQVLATLCAVYPPEACILIVRVVDNRSTGGKFDGRHCGH